MDSHSNSRFEYSIVGVGRINEPVPVPYGPTIAELVLMTGSLKMREGPRRLS